MLIDLFSYKIITETIQTLRRQRLQAKKDLIVLENEKKKALEDPGLFVEELIYKVPIIGLFSCRSSQFSQQLMSFDFDFDFDFREVTNFRKGKIFVKFPKSTSTNTHD
jgi:hypothetical protein